MLDNANIRKDFPMLQKTMQSHRFRLSGQQAQRP